MAATLAGTGTGWVTSNTVVSGDVPISKPANLAVGHLLITVVGVHNASATLITAPRSGMTRIAQQTTGTVNAVVNVFAEPIPDSTALAAVPSSDTFASPSSSRSAAIRFILTGADLDAFTDSFVVTADHTALGSSSDPIVSPAITPAAADDVIIAVAWSNQGTDVVTNLTEPAGMTTVVAGGVHMGASGASRSTMAAAVKTLVGGSGVAQGPFNWQASPVASNSDAWTIAVKAKVLAPPSNARYLYLKRSDGLYRYRTWVWTGSAWSQHKIVLADVSPVTPTSGTPDMPTVPAFGAFPDQHSFSDFTNLNVNGIAPGVTVAGTDWSTTGYGMVPNTSTKASSIPTAKYATNQLYLMATPTGTSTTRTPGIEWHHFALIGTPQGHMYHGIRCRYAAAPYFHDLLIKGVPGNDSAPPGETFYIDISQTDDALLERIVCDGRDATGAHVGASPIGLNNARRTTIRNCRSNYCGSGIAFTAWQSTDVDVIDCDFSNSRRAVNLERPSGTYRLTRVNLTNQTSTSHHISCVSDQSSAKLIITDPIVEWPLKILTSHPGGMYLGNPSTQLKSDISVIKDGVDITNNTSYVVFI